MQDDVKDHPQELPPVPIRRGFVVVLAAVVVLTVAPFGFAFLFSSSDSVPIEPMARWASVLAMFGAPLAAAVLGRRRGMVVRSAVIAAGAIMSISCLALLFAVTLTAGPSQVIATGAIAGAAVTLARKVKPNVARRIPSRPDRFGRPDEPISPG
jgi:hypothetical protein